MPKIVRNSNISTEYSSRIKEKSKNDYRFALDVFLLEFSEELSKQMERRNLSKARLASLLGTSRSYVTQVLNGKPNLQLETLFKLCFSVGLRPQTQFLMSDENLSQFDKSKTVMDAHPQEFKVDIKETEGYEATR